MKWSSDDCLHVFPAITCHLKKVYQERDTWKEMYQDISYGILPEHFKEEDWIMNPMFVVNVDLEKVVHPHRDGAEVTKQQMKEKPVSWDDLDEVFEYLTKETGSSDNKVDIDQSENPNSFIGEEEATTTELDRNEEANFIDKESSGIESNADQEISEQTFISEVETDQTEESDAAAEKDQIQNLGNQETKRKPCIDHTTENIQFSKKKSKLLQINGKPGMGKSAALRCLALNWSKEESDSLQNYHALFVIPLLQVDTQSSLTEILGDSQLGLVPKSEEDQFKKYVSVPSSASKVMFLIDNVGDTYIPDNSDLGRLLQGTLHKTSTVIVFTRHNLKKFELLTTIQPLATLDLIGMDEVGLFEFTELFFNYYTTAKVSTIIKTFKTNVYDLALISGPFNAALLCSIIQNQNGNIDPENLGVPNKMTPLLTAWCHVLLNHWIKHDQDEPADLTYDRSPLEDESTVPVEIQNLLYKFGHLCFKGLMSNEAEFSQNDLQECQLKVSDMERNIFFKTCINDEDSGIVYARSITLQSYLAGLYLSYEGVQEKEFLHIFETARAEPAPLAYILDEYNLIAAVQFACGLSEKFFEDLMQVIKRSCILLKNLECECVDIYYECSLFQEANHESMLSHFQSFLLALPIQMCPQTFFSQHLVVYAGKFGIIQYYQNCLSRTLSKFNQSACLPFLLKFYQLAIQEGFIRRVVLLDGVPQVVSKDHLILGLDQLQIEMLSRFQFVNTKAVIVRSRSATYFDIEALLRIMKGIKVIDIVATFIIPHGCSQYPENHDLENSLTSLSLISTSCRVKLTRPSHIELIAAQENLKHLHLENVDIFNEFGKLEIDQNFPNLSEVHIMSQCDIDLSDGGLYSFLANCSSSLKKLQLSFHVRIESKSPLYIIRTELQEMRVNIPQPEQKALPWCSHGIPNKLLPLWIFHTQPFKLADQMLEMLSQTMQNSQVEELGVFLEQMTVPFIQKCVTKMPNVKLLAVSSSDLVREDAEKIITDALGHIPTLKCLHVWKYKSKTPDYTFPRECEESLHRLGIEVKIQVPKTPESLDEYSQLSKII